MRTIKFRAWFEGHMYEVANLDFWGDPDQANCDMVRKSLTEDGNVEEIFAVYLHEVELMQCTGLKDQHGKEIYEGDIVEFSHGGVVKAYVRHDNGAYDVVNEKDDVLLYLHAVNHKARIIGNVHDSPELIPEVPHA